MGFEPVWHMRQDVVLPLDDFIDSSIDDIVKAFAYIGEEAVNKARRINTYADKTGNLRSSIWYAVYVDGTKAELNVVNATSEANGAISAQISELLSTEIDRKGVTLVVGAGMEYAMAVEAKGYDVISGSTLGKSQFESILKELL